MALEQSVEAAKRLLVEGHPLELSGRQLGVLQAEGHRVDWQRGVVAEPRPPFLLRGSDERSVDGQGGRAVVGERREAEDGAPHAQGCASMKVKPSARRRAERRLPSGVG